MNSSHIAIIIGFIFKPYNCNVWTHSSTNFQYHNIKHFSGIIVESRMCIFIIRHCKFWHIYTGWDSWKLRGKNVLARHTSVRDFFFNGTGVMQETTKIYMIMLYATKRSPCHSMLTIPHCFNLGRVSMTWITVVSICLNWLIAPFT